MVEGADDRDRRPPPFNKAVKMGATIGMVVGWLVTLTYVFVAFPIPFGFQPNLQTKIDVILLAGPVLGAVVGAALGWFMRELELVQICPRNNKQRRRGSAARKHQSQGGQVGLESGHGRRNLPRPILHHEQLAARVLHWEHRPGVCIDRSAVRRARRRHRLALDQQDRRP